MWAGTSPRLTSAMTPARSVMARLQAEPGVGQPRDVVAPYALLVQRAAEVGKLSGIGIGQVRRLPARLGGTEDGLRQCLGVERADHRLLDTCPGRGQAMTPQHA